MGKYTDEPNNYGYNSLHCSVTESASCIKKPLSCRYSAVEVRSPPREVDLELLLVPDVADVLGVRVLREHPGAVNWVASCDLGKPEEMSRAAF